MAFTQNLQTDFQGTLELVTHVALTLLITPSPTSEEAGYLSTPSLRNQNQSPHATTLPPFG